jgi:ATP-binding cassette subfamily B protein
VIAHRLSAIVRADRVVVLDGGRVAQQGAHGQLATQAGPYRDLVEPQRDPRPAAPA